MHTINGLVTRSKPRHVHNVARLPDGTFDALVDVTVNMPRTTKTVRTTKKDGTLLKKPVVDTVTEDVVVTRRIITNIKRRSTLRKMQGLKN